MSIKKIAFLFLLIFPISVFAITAEECKAQFKLKGNTGLQFSDITLNKWNTKILPKIWNDKGGHFLSRMKEVDRGQAAGIYTPSELQSFFMGGTLTHNQGSRYEISQRMGKQYSVLFDVSKHNCQLVTFLINS